MPDSFSKYRSVSALRPPSESGGRNEARKGIATMFWGPLARLGKRVNSLAFQAFGPRYNRHPLLFVRRGFGRFFSYRITSGLFIGEVQHAFKP